jgi:7-cyano-7-deazaguanine synthase in queuosine biosynthesis
MDAKSILGHYGVPNQMPFDYTVSMSRSPSRIIECSGVANELWKLVALLHIIERARPSVDEIEFSTQFDELAGLSERLEGLFEFLTSGMSVKIRIQRSSKKSIQRILSEARLSQPIVLFSGGLDSLAAALSISRTACPVLFHATTSNVILAKVRELKDSSSALSGCPMTAGDCRFASLGGGSAQTRGLLFLASAANVASTLGIDRIVVGENGPLMINAQVSPFSIPSKTAHPRLIVEFESILQDLLVDLHIDAVHKDMTKSEVVLGVREDLGESLHKSYSCWRTQGLKAMCGMCFACFVRRLSLLATGIAEDDSVYEADPFRADFSQLDPAGQNAVSDLKDSLTYYKRFAMRCDEPVGWDSGISASFFEDPVALLRRFSTDLFVGIRSYSKSHDHVGPYNALYRYCLDSIQEIGTGRLDERESELRHGPSILGQTTFG